MEKVFPVNSRLLLKAVTGERKVGDVYLADSAEAADRAEVGEVMLDTHIEANPYTGVEDRLYRKGAKVLFESISIRQKVVHQDENCFLIPAKHIIGLLSE